METSERTYRTHCQCGQGIEFAEEMLGASADCPECGQEVPLTDESPAATASKRTKTLILLCGLGMAIAISVMAFLGNPPSEQIPYSPDMSWDAREGEHGGTQVTVGTFRTTLADQLREAAIQMVPAALVAPSTATFSPKNEIRVFETFGPHDYRVEGWVDAQNKFGAMIRWRYIVILEQQSEGTFVSKKVSVTEP